MSKTLLALSLTWLLVIGIAAKDGSPANPQYVDLTADFTRFADETRGMDEAARVAKFHQRMGPLLPGFYEPRFGLTPERYDRKIARALDGFDALRPRYQRVQEDFPAAFAAGMQQFRQQFPGFAPHVPVYLLHSLGEMDGGTRELNGKVSLVFGADVIAEIHEPKDLTPFLDHELFHVENQKFFTECGEVWCLLWSEGLATYAAKVMNPGASDQQLLLTSPRPIRAAVDANWPAALCFTQSRLFSSESADMDALFVGGSATQGFPDRFGYYVGLRVIEELGGQYRLPALAHMLPAQAKTVLTGGVERLVQKAGGCK